MSPTYQELDIYKCYLNSSYLSFKHSTYFHPYDDLLSKYRGMEITFVEIGVLNGGSLFMWRNYFGAQARIIGIDLNPEAKKWETDGFEIYIGNQANPKFWDAFFTSVGKVDIILDDGGHTNEQQVVTAHKSIPNINDNGLLLVEDVHTSYFTEFGNPSRHSFISYSKTLVDRINSRSSLVGASTSGLKGYIYSIQFFESIVAFKIDRSRCFTSSITSNGKISSNAQDFRHSGGKMRFVEKIHLFLNRHFSFLKKSQVAKHIAKKIYTLIPFLSARMQSRHLEKYFR